MTRTIIHLDLDAFFCSVEEKLNPSLRGKPFTVGGRPDSRGVVSSCSYAARRFGVRSAMPSARALRLCPELVILPARHSLYAEASAQVMAILQQESAMFEQVSIDEAYLDVSDHPEGGEAVARRLQQRIRDELQLPSSLGIAANKLVAKIATDVGKRTSLQAEKPKGSSGPPCAITIVPPGDEACFLAPLPAEMLLGVGPKTAARLAELGLHTVGQIADWPESELVARFGETGRYLARCARGIDDCPVTSEHEVKSISQEVTFAHDLRDDKVLERTLRELSAEVGRRLRKEKMAGATVKIKLRWPDFTTLTRQTTLQQPSDQDEEIAAAALALLARVRPAGKAVRLIGVGVSRLGPPVHQLGLWEVGSEKSRRLQQVVDELKERFGDSAIQRGSKTNTRGRRKLTPEE